MLDGLSQHAEGTESTFYSGAYLCEDPKQALFRTLLKCGAYERWSSHLTRLIGECCPPVQYGVDLEPRGVILNGGLSRRFGHLLFASFELNGQVLEHSAILNLEY